MMSSHSLLALPTNIYFSFLVGWVYQIHISLTVRVFDEQHVRYNQTMSFNPWFLLVFEEKKRCNISIPKGA